jgi:hypothetical protein
MEEEGVWIFVDYSNLLIRAKEWYKRHRNYHELSTVQIDLEKLEQLLCKGRMLEGAFVYGSEEMKEEIDLGLDEDTKWQVRTFPKSIHSGKEKQVSML